MSATRRAPSKARKATVVDVARLAKVSTASVSRVFNGNGDAGLVSDETRERVIAAAQMVRYTPNMIARSFRSQKSHAIGLIVFELGHPHIAQVIEGVEQAAHEAGYIYVLSNSGDAAKREKLCRGLFGQNRIDGAVLIGLSTPEEEDLMVSSLTRDGIPVALVGRIHAHAAVPCVSLDNVQGGQMATRHLLDQGRRRILYVAGDHYHSPLRLKGYRQALAAAGVEAEPALVIGGEGRDAAYAQAHVKNFLSRNAAPTGVFCFNDKMAFGVLKALHEHGLSVPGDCAVVGFDNIEYCQYSVPTLTSVSQPSFQMGYAAGKQLLARLEGKLDPEKRSTVFAPTLVVRESSGPAPKTTC